MKNTQPEPEGATRVGFSGNESGDSSHPNVYSPAVTEIDSTEFGRTSGVVDREDQCENVTSDSTLHSFSFSRRSRES